ncbi:MAG: T9SS type A sorting domain-containing protein [Melioribacteraceae bacterium]|nr:T9SS type A sorting domain-containing protein [Melioribacteraceae bacterium]MCF8264869.1 T9SS type A sorting domain-containing protein [Melioribacteraceae bacterium]
MKYVFLLVFLCSSTLFSQTDPERWYPLDVGNRWIYWAYNTDTFSPNHGEIFYKFEEVVGDTTIDSLTYKILHRSWSDSFAEYFLYYREEGDKLFEYQPSYLEECWPNEILLLDFADLPDTTIWKLCSLNDTTYIGRLFRTNWRAYIAELNEYYNTKYFQNVWVERRDTLYTPIGLQGTGGVGISKGIGKTWELVWHKGNYNLLGCIIGKQKYGTIVGVNNDHAEIDENADVNLKVHPNPFNLTTTISLVLEQDGKIELAVYSITGEKLKVITEKFLTEGRHTISFTPQDLASGTYLLVAHIAEKILATKIILLK